MTSAHPIVLAGCPFSITTWMTVAAMMPHISVILNMYSQLSI